MTEQLLVFIDTVLAGVVSGEPTPTGRRLLFNYEAAYLAAGDRTPLSLSIPTDTGIHDITAWVDGLLPDDRDTRRQWARELQAPGADAMSLLATPVGLDCAGAVQFCAPGSEHLLQHQPSGIDWHTETDIADWIRRVRLGEERREERSPTIGHRPRFSLGGFQPKTTLYYEGDTGQWGSPYGYVPSTHIFKPLVRGHRDGELVEHITTDAAARLGLDVARTRLERFADQRVLIVERYDRVHEEGGLRRMHQEDLCQALGRRPDDKYQSEGGPTPAEIVDVIVDHSVAPRRDLQGFLDALIYNWVVAAPDGHAKNYSLLLDEQSVALAPLYDLISYLPYRRGTVVDKLTIAIRVGRDYTLRKHDRPSAWKTAAALIRVDPTTAIERAADILARCPEAVDAAIDNLDAQDRASPYTAAMSGEVLQRRNSALGGLRAPRRRQGSKPGSGAGSDTPAAPAGSIKCGQRLRPGVTCQRKLVTKPCPDHASSPGSQQIKRRASGI